MKTRARERRRRILLSLRRSRAVPDRRLSSGIFSVSRPSLLLCVPAFAFFADAGCVQRAGQIPPWENPYHPSYMMNRVGWISGGWLGENRVPYAYEPPDAKETYCDPFFAEERFFPRDPFPRKHKKPPPKKKKPKPHGKPPPPHEKPPSGKPPPGKPPPHGKPPHGGKPPPGNVPPPKKDDPREREKKTNGNA